MVDETESAEADRMSRCVTVTSWSSMWTLQQHNYRLDSQLTRGTPPVGEVSNQRTDCRLGAAAKRTDDWER